MNIVRCDINTCKREIKSGEAVKKARLLNKEYDMCQTCFDHLEKFINDRLDGGVVQYNLQPTWNPPQVLNPQPVYVGTGNPGYGVVIGTGGFNSNGNTIATASPVSAMPYDEFLQKYSLSANPIGGDLPSELGAMYDLVNPKGILIPVSSTPLTITQTK